MAYYENNDETLTIKQLQKYLHCGRTKVLDLIHSGVIEAHMVCGKWIIIKSDAEEFLRMS